MSDFTDNDFEAFSSKHSKITTTTVSITEKKIVKEEIVKPLSYSSFFDEIFDKENGYVRVENLKTLDEKFEEMFDANKLAFIINNEKEIKRSYRENAHDNVALDNFYSLSKNGLKPTEYKQIDNGLHGRLYATTGSGQGMVREVRHTIFNDYYVDLDIDNCHPVITVALCEWLGLDCGHMKEYVVDRENKIKELRDLNPTKTRDDIKHLFLTINYGGKSAYSQIKKNAFLKSYYEEVIYTRKSILAKFSKFRDVSNSLCKEKNIKKGFNADYNLDGSALSQLCGMIENYILMCVLDYLKTNIGCINNCILCFDGVMIDKRLFNDSIISDLEKIFGNKGLNIKFSTKPMHPLDIESMGYDANKVYTIVKTAPQSKRERKKTEGEVLLDIYDAIGEAVGELDKDLIRINDGIEFNDILMHYDNFTVDELALLIRKTLVRIENSAEPVYFVKENYECKYKRTIVRGIKYVPKQPLSLKSYTIPITFNDETFEPKLSDVLDAIRPYICYRRAVNEPYGALEKNKSDERQSFNLFPGFIHKYDPSFKPDERVVSVWTDHLKHVLANGDERVYMHLLRIFKHMLINPMDKSGTVIIVKGKQGSGKNSVFDIFYRFVLGPQLSLTTPSMDLIAGRFNSIRQSLIACCLDEALDSMDRSTNNKLKNLITADEVQIEMKGKDAYTVGDFCNYVVISNNDFASLVEESDRRAFCMETNNSKKGNKAYFNKYYNTVGDVTAGKHLFHWLINCVETPKNWSAQDIPKTEYKVELKEAQASSTVKFLLDTLNERIENECYEESTISNSELWEMFKSYCEQNKQRGVSSTAFYRIVAKYTVPCRVADVRSKVISVAILRDSLSEYIYAE
jgi:hypothetical protein